LQAKRQKVCIEMDSVAPTDNQQPGRTRCAACSIRYRSVQLASKARASQISDNYSPR